MKARPPSGGAPAPQIGAVPAMPILRRLISLYEKRGIQISTGLNPCHFGNLPQANFTWFLRDGKNLTNGLGIAMQEVYFLECLFERFHPRTVFAIGNSAGWSSLALALLNPQARCVAIDAGFDRNALAGIDFTNGVAAEEGLNLTVVKAMSPDGVAAVVRDAGAAPLEFAFIDGYHAADQVVRDFLALQAHADPACVYLFHDVHEFGLEPGIAEIVARSGLSSELLLGTPSGMAIVYDRARLPSLADDIAPFRAHPAALALLEREALRRRHRRAYKLGRSLARRATWLRRRFGTTARPV
jgi:predicted O-methyltransferase YrrM